ncbi:TPA: hypothetical protein ACH3X1_004918 [Trebouxia sp. C0004]
MHEIAAQNTMPQACKRSCTHSRKHQPWFDSSCREALALKEAVYKSLHSTAAEKDVAEKKFRSVTDRVKETWTQKRNVELCELSARDPSQFWKAFKAPQSNACPVELSAQFEAFRGLMGAEPQSAPQRPADSGAGGTWCPWQNPGHHQVSVCTRQRSSAVIARHFCHLQMSHGGEARMSAESYSVWFVC